MQPRGEMLLERGSRAGREAEQTSLQEEGACKHPGKPGAEGTHQNGNKKPKHGCLRQQNPIPSSTPGLAGPSHGGGRAQRLPSRSRCPAHAPATPRSGPVGMRPPTNAGIKNQPGPAHAMPWLLLGVRAGQRDPPGSVQGAKRSPGAGAGGALRDGSACSASGSSTRGHHSPEFSSDTWHVGAGCAANPPPKHF